MLLGRAACAGFLMLLAIPSLAQAQVIRCPDMNPFNAVLAIESVDWDVALPGAEFDAMVLTLGPDGASLECRYGTVTVTTRYAGTCELVGGGRSAVSPPADGRSECLADEVTDCAALCRPE